MSFFSKLTDKAEGYLNKDKSHVQQQQQQLYDNYPQSQQQFYQSPQQQYGQVATQQHDSHSQQYRNTPQYDQQNHHTTPQSNICPNPPQVPQGWQPLWDPAGARWVLLELATSKVNFAGPYNVVEHGYAARDGYGVSGGQGAYGAAPDGGYGTIQGVVEKKNNNGRNMALGVAGGLAAGAIGGALVMDAVDDHEDEERRSAEQQQTQFEDERSSGFGSAPLGDRPLPEEDRNGDSVSSSDREDVEEAREEYEEAYEEAYDD